MPKQTKATNSDTAASDKVESEHGELGEWTVDDVVEWIQTLEQGRFERHAKAFKKAKINGKKLKLLKTDRALSMKVKIKDNKARPKIRMHIENLLKRMQRRARMKKDTKSKDSKKKKDAKNSGGKNGKGKEKKSTKDKDNKKQNKGKGGDKGSKKDESSQSAGLSNTAAKNHPLARLQSNLTTTFSNLATTMDVPEPVRIMEAANDDDASTIVTETSDQDPGIDGSPVQYEGGLLNDQLSVIYTFLRHADAVTDAGLSTFLPQIVVTGRRGSGKTSVVQAITGLPLPIFSNTATDTSLTPHTLCPLRIIKRKTAHPDEFHCAVKIHWLYDERDEPLRLASPMFEQIIAFSQSQLVYTDLVRDIVTAQQRVLTHSNNSPISRNEVWIEMEAGEIDDIHLIELPGFSGDPGTDKIVMELMESYMKTDNVHLSVIPSTEDIRQEHAYDLMQRYDPDQTKTIGIITKLDSIQHELHGQWVNILSGRMRPIRNGYVGVRNLADSERQNGMSLQQGLQLEYQLFHTNPDWSSTPNKERHLGNNALLHIIRQTLSQKTLNQLPQLKNKIDKMLHVTMEQLRGFPPIIPVHHAQTVAEVLTKRLHKEFEIQLRESTEPNIFSYLQKSYQYFMMQIAKARPHFALHPEDSKQFSVCFTLEDAQHILDWAKQEEARGEGVLLHRAREVFMTQITGHWMKPMMNCVGQVASAMSKGIEHVIEKVLGPFLGLKEVCKQQCGLLLEQLTQFAIERVQIVLDQERKPYGTADPVRLQRRADAYMASLQKRDTKKVWLSKPDLAKIATTIEGYFDIALLRFGDNVPITIDATMCKEFLKNLLPILTDSLALQISSNEDIHPMILPESHIVAAAKASRCIIENLNGALQHINTMRPDISVQLADLGGDDPVAHLKYGDVPLEPLLEREIIDDLERERHMLRGQLGIGEVDFHDLKILREQLKGEQQQLISQRQMIEEEKDRLEADHVQRSREHKKLEGEIREMTKLIEEQRAKVQDEYSEVSEVKAGLNGERVDFEQERDKMKEKIEQARSALIAANEQLIAEQKKLQLEKDTLVTQWKHFEERKQDGMFGEDAKKATVFNDEAVKLEKEMLSQEKANLEKEWSLLAVLKAQMEETREQLMMDSEATTRIRDQLKASQFAFKRDAMELKQHADSLAAAREEQTKLADQVRQARKQLEEQKLDLDVRQEEIQREANVLNSLQQHMADKMGLDKGNFKDAIEEGLSKLSQKEKEIHNEKANLENLRKQIEADKEELSRLTKDVEQTTAHIEDAQQITSDQKIQLQRMKTEMHRELKQMEVEKDEMDRERAEIARAKQELRQLQAEVASDMLASSMKTSHTIHDREASKGSLNFDAFNESDDGDGPVTMKSIHDQNITLSMMLKQARKARQNLLMEAGVKVVHQEKQRKNPVDNLENDTSAATKQQEMPPAAVLRNESFRLSPQEIVERTKLSEKKADKQTSNPGLTNDLSTLIDQMRNHLIEVEKNPDILKRPAPQGPTEKERAELEKEKHSLRTQLQRMSSRDSVKSRVSSRQSFNRAPGPRTKLTIPSVTIPQGNNEDEEDMGLDSLLTHLEGELDNLTSKKANPFDLISPKYKPNHNIAQLRERTMSTIFQSEDLIPLNSLIHVNETLSETKDEEAKAEEVLQRMIDNITQMQQNETEVLQEMEAFERHHQTKLSLGGTEQMPIFDFPTY